MSDIQPRAPARLVLRVAALVATVQAVGHLTLFLRSQPHPASAAWPVVQAMQSQPGPQHTTYWGMYYGYGILSVVTAFLIGGCIWLAAAFDEGSRKLARLLILLVLAAVVLHAIIVHAYFFRIPLWFDLALAPLLAVGWWQSRE